MQRKFLANVAVLIAANLLVKPFWILGIDRSVQNAAGTAEYGLYFAVFNFSFLFSLLADMGLNNYNTQELARNPAEAANRFGRIFGLKLVFSFVYFVLTLLLAALIGFQAQHFELLYWLALNQILMSLLLYFRSNFAALQWFRVDSLFSVLDRLLAIGFCSILLWTPKTGAEFQIIWFVHAQTAALGISLLMAATTFLNRIGTDLPSIDTAQWRSIIREAFPFAILGILMAVYQRTDAVMIERMLPETGAEESGKYAAGYRLLDASAMVGFMFAAYLMPIYARALKEKKDIGKLLESASRYLLSFGLVLMVAGVAFAEPIMELLYDSADASWAKCFRPVIGTLPAICIMYAYGSLMTAGRKLKALNLISAAGVLANILLNLWLIPKEGAYGAAIATLVTQSLVAVLHVLIAHRSFPLKLKDYAGSWMRLTVLVSCCAILAYQLSAGMERPLTAMILVGLAGLVLMVLLKLIRIDDWLHLGNEEEAMQAEE